ncbi:hypothetical protein CPB83DRAFT_858832 [Crepidotus variabilis]|uniref:Uncharacterized protein n=1 Tax=Crepidotus variabilis TaxID=179855 RepID=A0A9P6EBE5_9AGAR|nr:hypothetical protein CPB83DRAFT_858832 [Crepidotus variabilis]
MVYVTYNATCRIGPHPTLQCVDFLFQDRSLDVYFTTVDTPSFLGVRKLFGLPLFTYQWLHNLNTTTATEMDDSFEVNLFQHCLNKTGRNISWDVAMSTPRSSELEDSIERSMATCGSDTVKSDSEDTGSWKNILSWLNDTPYDSSSENSDNDDEGSTWASDNSSAGDMDMSDGSTGHLLDDELDGREVDAECDLFENLLSGTVTEQAENV